jgi:hypothetical protein
MRPLVDREIQRRRATTAPRHGSIDKARLLQLRCRRHASLVRICSSNLFDADPRLYFSAILFLPPGIGKIVDRRGNLEWLNGYLAKSPLASMVPFLLTVLTILEATAGAVSAVGCVLVIVLRDLTVVFCGAVTSAVALIALFLASNRERLHWRGGASSLLSAHAGRNLFARAGVTRVRIRVNFQKWLHRQARFQRISG